MTDDTYIEIKNNVSTDSFSHPYPNNISLLHLYSYLTESVGQIYTRYKYQAFSTYFCGRMSQINRY